MTMASFMVDAWPGKVTLSFISKERYLIFTLAPEEATAIGALLVDRADKAREEEDDAPE